MQLEKLLAPTWEARKQADEELFHFSINDESKRRFSKMLQTQIQAMPDGNTFVKDMLAFWGTVIFKQYKSRMGRHCKIDSWAITFAYSEKAFADMDMRRIRPDLLCGFGVLQVLENLNFTDMDADFEAVLVCCLRHGESVVIGAAEKALGSMPTISDDSFRQFWQLSASSNSDYVLRRQYLVKHLNPTRLQLLFTAILDNKRQKNEITSPACMALGTLNYARGESAKIAHAFLQENLTTKRSPVAQATLIHSLTTLSKQYGFSEPVIAYCQTHLGNEHRGDKYDNDRLYSAYTNYLSAHDLQANIDVLQTVNTPWALSTLCRNLKEADVIPFAILQHAVGKSLGNYDGFDGMPHDDAVELLLQRDEYIEKCQYLIYAWWNNLCHQAGVEGYWENEELETAIAFIKVLKTQAQPMLKGLEQALNWLIQTDIDNTEEDFSVVQAKFSDKMQKLGYSEAQIQIQIANQTILVETFKQLLKNETLLHSKDDGFFFTEDFAYEEDDSYGDEEETEEDYQANTMILTLAQAIALIGVG